MNLTTEEEKKFREFGYINKLIFKDSECEFLKNHFGNLIKVLAISKTSILEALMILCLFITIT